MSVRVHIIIVSVVCLRLADAEGGLDLGKGLEAMKYAKYLNHPLVKKALTFDVKDLSKKIEQVAIAVEKTVDRLTSMSTAIVGASSGQQLVDALKQKLHTQIELAFQSHCIEDIQFTSMNYFKGMVTLEGGDTFKLQARSDDDGLDSLQNVVISLELKELSVTYDFKTKTGGLSRAGYVAMTYDGVTSLNLAVKAPTDSKEVRKHVDEEKCFMTVTKLYLDTPPTFKEVDVVYDSLLHGTGNVGITKQRVEELVRMDETKAKIKVRLEKTLRKVFEPIIADPRFFCDPQKLTFTENLQCDLDE